MKIKYRLTGEIYRFDHDDGDYIIGRWVGWELTYENLEEAKLQAKECESKKEYRNIKLFEMREIDFKAPVGG